MIVACCVDRNYLDLAGAMLRSLETNGNVPEVQLVVCGLNLTSRDENLLAKSVSRTIRFVRINTQQRRRLSSLPVRRQTTTATYVRLLLPDLLADTTGRLLYLDSDIIINNSLRPIFEVELNGHALAAVPDGPLKFVSWRNRSLGRPPDAPYFNAGVQLIDMERWRQHELGAKAISFAEVNSSILDWLDQDALNMVVGADWSALPHACNWCTEGESPGSFTAARVIHFTSKFKPNHMDCSHPAKELYMLHRANTPWQNTPLRPYQKGGGPGLFPNAGANVRSLGKAIAGRLGWHSNN